MTEGKQDDPSITVQGVRFDWKPENGLFNVFNMPTLAMWVETTVAGMMEGMQRMVGTDRFNLAMHGGGRDSIAGDWSVIAAAPSFEQGFAELASYAVTCGWGVWTLVSLDRTRQEAVFRVVNNWESLYQRSLDVQWGTNMTGGKFAGLCSKLFGIDCWATQTRFQARGDECDEFVVKRSDTSLEEKLNQLLATDQATRADLAVALERLEHENAERRRAEREAQERLALIETLSAPILQVWDGVLAVPVLGTLAGERAASLMERLLAEIQRTRSNHAILDVTGVDVIDTHTANYLLKIARSVELLGGQCIITGIRPAVAQTMVNLDTGFGSIVTLATLRDGIKYCMHRSTPSK
ncbi:MAG TPA: STAS domain-containing protein [Enhygromyxa sp.]|nr:STAS domain-containing protein [Enhygromyxa sp.]